MTVVGEGPDRRQPVGQGSRPRPDVLARMTTIGERLHARLGPGAAESLRHHPSDLVRGVRRGGNRRPHREPRPFADAEMTVVGEGPDRRQPVGQGRRFASEATRPCGVWCRHLASLKADPAPGLAILAPAQAAPGDPLGRRAGSGGAPLGDDGPDPVGPEAGGRAGCGAATSPP
jgi:hypothetical protein